MADEEMEGDALMIATQAFAELLECTPPWEPVPVPNQGHWTVAEYLALDTTRLVEFTDGQLEVLPMPSVRHQEVVLYLYRLLFTFVSARQLGKVLTAPLPTYVTPTRYREPDVVVVLKANAWRAARQLPGGGRSRRGGGQSRRPPPGLRAQRADYAAAGIPEYWIVDPQHETITVLTLDGEQYQERGFFHTGDEATSALLAGFTVGVSELFAQAT